VFAEPVVIEFKALTPNAVLVDILLAPLPTVSPLMVASPDAVTLPVEGLNVNLVDETFIGKLPVVVVTHVGYIVALVVVSFVIAIFVAVAALPVIDTPQVPVAPVPSVEGTSKLVLAVDASEAFVPPLAIGNIPVTPVVSGNPVALVRVAEAGVPKAITFPLESV